MQTIMCAQCHRPVERIERYTSLALNDTIYRVFCHGEEEETRLSGHTIVTALRIDPGYAFTTNRIDHSRGDDDATKTQRRRTAAGQ